MFIIIKLLLLSRFLYIDDSYAYLLSVVLFQYYEHKCLSVATLEAAVHAQQVTCAVSVALPTI
jgi:hypothetical protein